MTETKLKEKIYKAIFDEIISKMEIISNDGKMVEFKIPDIDGVYNIVMKQAPLWFQEFEKRNNKRFDNLEVKVDKNTESINRVSSRITNIVKLNNLKE